MKYALIDSNNLVVEVLSMSAEQATAFNCIACDDSVEVGSLHFNGMLYPKQPSKYHYFDYNLKKWVLDVKKQFLEVKNAKKLEIESAIKTNGAHPVPINNPTTGAVLIPPGSEGNDFIISLIIKTSTLKDLEPIGYVFIPFTAENQAESSVLFSNDTETKAVTITCFGAVKFGAINPKIKAKTAYARIDLLTKPARDHIVSAIRRMKKEDSDYRRQLLLALDNATTIEQINSIVVKTKQLNNNKLTNVGFNPVLWIENGVVITNTTDLEVEI